MKNAESPEKQTVLLPQEVLVGFVEAFYRIFKVGIYYPIGHVVLNQSAVNCIQQLRKISPSLKCVKIEVDKNGLLVQGIRLPDTQLAVRELFQLISNLGILSIEIDRTILLTPLLHFVKNLLGWRSQMETTQTFINFSVVDLPEGIHLEQQEFLVDSASIHHEDSDHDYRQKLEEVCHALSEQGLDEPQIEQCRIFLEQLSQPVEGKEKKIEGFPNATWQDVQTLLFKIVTGAYSPEEHSIESVSNNDIDVIASIFAGLETTLVDKKSKETIQLLLSHLVGRKSNQPEKVNKPSQHVKKMRQLLSEGEKISVAEIEKFIYENRIPLKVLSQITSVDCSEEMSIVFQLILPRQSRELYEKLEQGLKSILAGRLTSRGKDVLAGGILHFASLENFTFFRKLLVSVLLALRESEYLTSLDFLIDLCGKMPKARHTLLWPFVVNELLHVGIGEAREKFLEATEIASRLHADGMKSMWSQLEELDVFREKKVAESFFIPSAVSSYHLFAFLLETSLRDIIAEDVLSALQSEPQDPLFRAVGPILEISIPSHSEFLHLYLSLAHLEEPPLILKMAGGKIILDYLQDISEENKEFPWLTKTIEATAVLYVKGMQTMLGKIVKEKKLGLLPTWPRKCRTAAAASLKKLKRRSLAELL
jgi:hypothetical protein